MEKRRTPAICGCPSFSGVLLFLLAQDFLKDFRKAVAAGRVLTWSSDGASLEEQRTGAAQAHLP